MRNKQVILALTVLLNFSFLVFAETIVLKSGKVVKGRMLDMTADRIEISVAGETISYKLEDIKSIDGKKFRLPPRIDRKKSVVKEKSYFSKEKNYPPKEILFGPKRKTRISLDKKTTLSPRRAKKGTLNQAKSYFQIAYIHASLGEARQAKKNYKRALEVEPDLGQIYLEEGATQHFLGNRIEARENILKAIELFKFTKDFQHLEIANDYLQKLY